MSGETHRGSVSRLTGPERFWVAPRRKLIVAACFAVSLGVHYELAPWSFLPKREFEIRDTAGDLAIPVDILEGDTAQEAPPSKPPSDPMTPAPVAPVGPAKGDSPDAGVPAARSLNSDASPPRVTHDAGDEVAPRRPDAGPRVHDAGALLKPEAHPDPSSSPSLLDGGAGAGKHEDAAVARTGQATGAARDAVGMIGAAGSAQAGPQNVIVTINMGVIRTHPVGSRIGPLFSALPQWDDFLAGTGVDPLRDTDWVSINGPSLIHSDRDVILVHYEAPDALVDRALDVVGRKTGNGGPFDAGAPGVKSVLGHADRADRVFMRPQPHVLAVVPPYYAATAARLLAHATIPRTPKRPTEAMRMTLIHPHGPMPAVPETVTELRVWVVPRNADGGADVFGEGDTPAPEAARDAAAGLAAILRDQNSFGVKLITHGLLDGVELRADGPLVKLHIPISREQLEVILAFSAGRLGVELKPPDAGVARSASSSAPPRP